MAANFPCPLQSCTVGFSLFIFKILFAKLAIKSPYLTDSERSAAELYLLIFYCVLPENLCFCVLCIIMIRLSYNKLFWKWRLKSYPLRTFVFFVCTWEAADGFCTPDSPGNFFELLVPKVLCVSLLCSSSTSSMLVTIPP